MFRSNTRAYQLGKKDRNKVLDTTGYFASTRSLSSLFDSFLHLKTDRGRCKNVVGGWAGLAERRFKIQPNAFFMAPVAQRVELARHLVMRLSQVRLLPGNHILGEMNRTDIRTISVFPIYGGHRSHRNTPLSLEFTSDKGRLCSRRL